MDKVLENYRNSLKKSIIEDSGIKKNAKFSMYSDGHPCQWKLVEDILENDLNFTWKRTDGPYGIIIYYITGYIKKEAEKEEEEAKSPVPESKTYPSDVVSVEDVEDVDPVLKKNM